MTDMITCPAKDCDYEGLKRSVLGHYSGTKDGEHPGGWNKAKELLSGGEAETTETQTTQSETSTETRETDTTGNPTFGTAEPVTEPEPATNRSQGTQSNTEQDLTCLDCGSELYDFRQFTAGQYHTVNGTQVYVRGDFQCSSCGKWWVDE